MEVTALLVAFLAWQLSCGGSGMRLAMKGSGSGRVTLRVGGLDWCPSSFEVSLLQPINTAASLRDLVANAKQVQTTVVP